MRERRSDARETFDARAHRSYLCTFVPLYLCTLHLDITLLTTRLARASGPSLSVRVSPRVDAPAAFSAYASSVFPFGFLNRTG